MGLSCIRGHTKVELFEFLEDAFDHVLLAAVLHHGLRTWRLSIAYLATDPSMFQTFRAMVSWMPFVARKKDSYLLVLAWSNRWGAWV